MRNLVDIPNIENVLKYYALTDKDMQFINNSTYNIPNFTDYGVDFSRNYDMWEKNKSHLFNLFGGKLKIVKDLGEQNVCTLDMINNLKQEFIYKNDKAFSFLIKIFLQVLPTSDISDNKLSEDIKVLDVLLKKNMKITKCFALLELNKDRLSKQQDLYSTFLQTLYVKGRLVLSIDPLDYITMSVSKSGWSSCHHPHGGYGTGAISYMNDNSTMIAYIETVDPMVATIHDETTDESVTIKMANKIWRQVVTINRDHDYTLQLRQYPNSSEVYNSAVSDLLKTLLEKESGINYISEKRILYNIENGWVLQDRNPELPKYLFYCDHANNNFEHLTSVMQSELKSISNLVQTIKDRKIERVIVGEVIYCACGCGEENYSSDAFVEEADDQYDRYEDDDDDQDYPIYREGEDE